MDFDPRWPDEPRDRDDYGRELSQGSRGGLSNPREREPLDARDVFTRDLELPRGPERERVWARDSDVRLRGSEVRTLATVGAFRVRASRRSPRRSGPTARPHRGDLRHVRELATDRYAVLYRCWRQDGERVLATASSPVVGKAMESGAGKIEPLVLPHAYSHLAPMAGVA